MSKDIRRETAVRPGGRSRRDGGGCGDAVARVTDAPWRLRHPPDDARPPPRSPHRDRANNRDPEDRDAGRKTVCPIGRRGCLDRTSPESVEQGPEATTERQKGPCHRPKFCCVFTALQQREGKVNGDPVYENPRTRKTWHEARGAVILRPWSACRVGGGALFVAGGTPHCEDVVVPKLS